MDSAYAAALEAKVRALPSIIQTARSFYAEHKADLERYHGGMPLGLLVAIAAIESSGKMVAGDASLGEYGYYQIASSTEAEFGVPSGFRKTPTGNISLASLEYAVEGARLSLRYPQIIPGSLDQWLCSRMVFVFGRSGTRKLIDAAGPLRAGQVYQSVMDWADRTGAMAIGGSSAAKVHYRLRMIGLTLQAAKAAGPMWASRPVVPPAPPGTVWKIPDDVKDALKPSYITMVLFAGALWALVQLGA